MSAPPRPEPPGPTGLREEKAEPLSPLRRLVAQRLSESRRSVPAGSVFDEVDLTALDDVIARHGESFRQRHAAELGRLVFVARAALDALADVPALNAELRHEIVLTRSHCDLGVPLAVDGGAVVGVVRDAQRLSFPELAVAVADLTRRGAAGRLQPDELHGATFSLVDAGAFGALLSTPTIDPPQTGTLGLHAVKPRPVAVGARVEVRPMMYLALSFDERLVAPAAGTTFLRRVRETLEDPVRLLLGA